MAKLTVLLMCSSGMSSTIIRKNMEIAAQKKGIDLTVTAKAESAVSIERDIVPADIILLAPQIRYIKNDIQKKAGEKPGKQEKGILKEQNSWYRREKRRFPWDMKVILT